MRGLLLDTHIWFWYLVGSARLPDPARHRIEGSRDLCWLSPISVWEVGMLAARGRIRLTVELRAWMATAQNRFPLNEAPLSNEVAVVSHEIRLPHRDPADRFLAATAMVYELTMLTVDQRLVALDWLPTEPA